MKASRRPALAARAVETGVDASIACTTSPTVVERTLPETWARITCHPWCRVWSSVHEQPHGSGTHAVRSGRHPADCAAGPAVWACGGLCWVRACVQSAPSAFRTMLLLAACERVEAAAALVPAAASNPGAWRPGQRACARCARRSTPRAARTTRTRRLAAASAS